MRPHHQIRVLVCPTQTFGSYHVKFSYTAPMDSARCLSYTSFSQIEKEMEDARVWAGIHFRSTDEESTELGRKIGARAVANYLWPR